MTAQDPRSIPVVPSVPGGQDKTASETELSPLLAATLEAATPGRERVLVVDLDPQRSAEHWMPIILDTPGTTNSVPKSADFVPDVPLPGPMYPKVD
ncbi:hypothetical protein ACFCY8_11485 [Streptomyces noursei]|uniref:hypothetical protein n=1 Tax=Streptomyces noursei TaxID=1971 RepID=UPI0035DC331B